MLSSKPRRNRLFYASGAISSSPAPAHTKVLTVVSRHMVRRGDPDPANPEPCRDQYLVCVHFDPAAKRGYSSEPEFNLAGSWVAERLTRLDESESPGIISHLRFYAKRVTLDVDSLKGGPHSLGAGIALWIGHSPGWSRLRNRSLVQLQILRIQSEVPVQSQTARCSPTKR
jgi:hypothetical protein